MTSTSGFTFPVPPKWRSLTRTSTSHHSGQISILLGGDNHRVFPTELDRDAQGVALYQSKLTRNYMIYGSVPSNSITWMEPSITSSINTVFIKSLVMQDLLDHSTTHDLPNQPEPSTKPESPTELAPPIGTNHLTEPNPPTEPNPLIYSNPPTGTDPPSTPESATKSDPTMEPALQPNCTPSLEQGNLSLRNKYKVSQKMEQRKTRKQELGSEQLKTISTRTLPAENIKIRLNFNHAQFI